MVHPYLSDQAFQHNQSHQWLLENHQNQVVLVGHEHQLDLVDLVIQKDQQVLGIPSVLVILVTLETQGVPTLLLDLVIH